MNPALKHLPALVVPVQSRRNGRVYYRLQMGTTSQAHSAVLCQRMRMIGQGCVVIGLASGPRDRAVSDQRYDEEPVAVASGGRGRGRAARGLGAQDARRLARGPAGRRNCRCDILLDRPPRRADERPARADPGPARSVQDQAGRSRRARRRRRKPNRVRDQRRRGQGRAARPRNAPAPVPARRRKSPRRFHPTKPGSRRPPSPRRRPGRRVRREA